MAFFPFFIDIQDKKCTIIGGGIIAARKAEALLPFGCSITAISPKFCEDFKQIKNIKCIQRPFAQGDLSDSFFVIAATDDPEINAEISAFCRTHNILVNVVDVMDECSFIFPALYRNKDIVAGITTSGKSPQMAALVRKTIAQAIPDYYGSIAERLGILRPLIKKKISAQQRRKDLFSLILQKMIATENNISDFEIENIIRGEKNEN